MTGEDKPVMDYPDFSPKEIEGATGGVPVSGESSRPVSGVSTDTRTIQPENLFVALRGPRFDGHDFLSQARARGAGAAMVDRWPLKGTAPDWPVWRVPDTLRAFGDLAGFHRRRFRPGLVAITGSTGKTTTKTILAHLLSEGNEVLATEGTQNNQVGVPLTLLKLEARHRFAVLEMGTNRWGEIRRLTELAQPTVGVITHIGPAHLETFGDLSGVLRAKAELWEAIDPSGMLVLNADDPLVWEAGRKLPQRRVWFTAEEGRQFPPGEEAIRAGWIQLDPWGSRCRIDGEIPFRLPLPGRHNLMNALAALAAAKVLGLDLRSAARRLESAPSVPGRLVQRMVEGCLVIDDSYNANPASVQAALEVLRGVEGPGRRILLIGDMLELGEQAQMLHRQVGRQVAASGVDLLITVGPLCRALLEGAFEAGFPRAAGRAFDSPEEAGEFVKEKLKPGDTLLLKGSRGMRMERVMECSIISSTH